MKVEKNIYICDLCKSEFNRSGYMWDLVLPAKGIYYNNATRIETVKLQVCEKCLKKLYDDMSKNVVSIEKPLGKKNIIKNF